MSFDLCKQEVLSDGLIEATDVFAMCFTVIFYSAVVTVVFKLNHMEGKPSERHH